MPKDDSFLKESDALRDLRVLEAIEADPAVSQRELASRLGVAVGIANACIHTLVRKGMIKVRGENNRSLSYHLTKRGVLHKTKLAVEWTRNTVNFYVHAREMVSEQVRRLVERGARRLVLVGSKELAEIAIIVAADYPETRVVGIVRADAGEARPQMLGVPIGEPEIIERLVPDAVLLSVAPEGEVLEVLTRARSERPEMMVASLYDNTM